MLSLDEMEVVDAITISFEEQLPTVSVQMNDSCDDSVSQFDSNYDRLGYEAVATGEEIADVTTSQAPIETNDDNAEDISTTNDYLLSLQKDIQS